MVEKRQRSTEFTDEQHPKGSHFLCEVRLYMRKGVVEGIEEELLDFEVRGESVEFRNEKGHQLEVIELESAFLA